MRIATVDGVRTLLVTHRPSGLAVVVDASIVVKWLAREQDSEAATRVMVDDRPLTAPDLLPVEVANVFWKKVRRGDMPTTELRPAITNLLAVDIELHHSTALLNRATHLAVETGHPVYDCLYLALATDMGAALATADRRLRQTAHDLGVELWGERPSSARQYAVTRFVVMIAARDPSSSHQRALSERR